MIQCHCHTTLKIYFHGSVWPGVEWYHSAPSTLTTGQWSVMLYRYPLPSSSLYTACTTTHYTTTTIHHHQPLFWHQVKYYSLLKSIKIFYFLTLVNKLLKLEENILRKILNITKIFEKYITKLFQFRFMRCCVVCCDQCVCVLGGF